MLNGSEEVIGKVTSGAFSPSLGYAVAMAYLNADSGLNSGDQVLLDAGRKKLNGTIVELPFYSEGTAGIKLK